MSIGKLSDLLGDMFSNYAQLYQAYKDFPLILQNQLIVWFLVALMLGVAIPIEQQLYGTYWSAGIIAAFSILNNAARLLQVLFKHINIVTTFKAILICDTLFFIATCFYYVNTSIFLYCSAVLSVFYSILSSLASNQYSILINAHFTDNFSDLQYLNSTLFVIGGICGSLALILIDSINSNYNIPLLLCVICMLISWQIHLLITTWKDIELISSE